MFKANWRAGHLDKVILLVWPNGKIKDVANFLMTFAKGCLNGEFIDVYTCREILCQNLG